MRIGNKEIVGALTPDSWIKVYDRVIGTADVGTTETLDQSYVGTSGDDAFGYPGAENVFQNIVPSVSGVLSKFEFNLKKVNSPTFTIVGRLYSVNTATFLPDQILATSNNTVAASSLSASYAYIAFTFDGYPIQAGVPYALVIAASASNASNYVHRQVTVSGTYLGGWGGHGTGVYPSIAGWGTDGTGQMYDHSFKQYYKANSITSLTISGIGGNYLVNSDFETWSAGTSTYPDGWSLYYGSGTIGRESSNVKVGTYSCKTINTGGGSFGVYTQMFLSGALPVSFWQGKTVTFGCWCKTSAASQVYIKMNDTTADYPSNIHTGSGNWEWLSVTATLSNSMTFLSPILYTDAGAVSTAYWDGAILMVGIFAPQTSSANISKYCLNGNTDEEYRLVCRFVNGYNGSTNYFIRPNNDTGANYGRQGLYGLNTTPGAYRNTGETSVFLTASDTLNYTAQVDTLIYAKSGYARTFISNEVQTVGTTLVTAVAGVGSVWNNTADSMAGITLYANQTDGIGLGSSIELWKKASKT
jgi:hypothetical protein